MSSTTVSAPSNLTLRVLTAAVLVPILLAAIYLDITASAVAALVVVAAVAAADEYLKMALGAGAGVGFRLVYALCVAGIVGGGARWGPDQVLGPGLTSCSLLLAITVLARIDRVEDAAKQFAAALSGLVYVPVLICVWPLIKGEYGTHWLTITLATAFLSDSVAYFTGRAIGKRPLAPAVSPKKTREGGIGGLMGGVLATVVGGSLWLLPQLPIVDALVLGVVGSAAGQVGDLVESMIKRSFKVKDSGRILPGHGGMLDRIDALLFVAPVMYYYCRFFTS